MYRKRFMKKKMERLCGYDSWKKDDTLMEKMEIYIKWCGYYEEENIVVLFHGYGEFML